MNVCCFWCIVHWRTWCWQRGSPHGTLGSDPMRIGDPDPKTVLPPHGLDLDLSCVLCCQSNSKMHLVMCHVGLIRDHIESGLGIRIQWIWFQCPCGEPQQCTSRTEVGPRALGYLCAWQYLCFHKLLFINNNQILHVLCSLISKLSTPSWKVIYASYSKLFKELRNNI